MGAQRWRLLLETGLLEVKKNVGCWKLDVGCWKFVIVQNPETGVK